MLHHDDERGRTDGRVRAVREEHVREAVGANGEVSRGVRCPPLGQVDAVPADDGEGEAVGGVEALNDDIR